MVAGYLTHDAKAASVLFAVYTSEVQNGHGRPQAKTIAALTGALAECGLPSGKGFWWVTKQFHRTTATQRTA